MTMAERIQHAIGDRPNRSRAEHDDQVSRFRHLRDLRRHGIEPGHDVQVADRPADLGGERVERHARDRRLACGVDIGQDDNVCERERGPEVGEEVAGPAVAVRLEERNQPRGVSGARRAKDCRDFCGMVPVIIDERHAADGAARLVAPLRAPEPGQGAHDSIERDAHLEADGDGRQRVLKVVLAGNR